MQYSVVNYKTVKENSDFRIDGEYFWPDFLKTETIIKKSNSQSVKSLSLDIRYGLNIEPVYTETGINFIRAQNLKEYGIEGEILKIPLSQDKVGNKNLLKSGDLLIVRSGANVGDIGIVTKKFNRSTFGSYVIKFDLKNKINPFFVYVFLKTTYGRNQTVRFRSGTAQPNISIPNLNQILIPVLSEKFQSTVEDIFFKSERKIEESYNLYSQAEQLLLSELELVDWKPKHTLAYVKNFSDTKQSERFDAEYFQPKYEEIVKAVEKYKGGFDELKYFISSYSTGFPFSSESYVEDGVYLVRINNIQKGNLELSNAIKIPLQDIELSKKDIAKENDILISMSGTIGNSCKIPTGIRAVINQRIFRFTSKNYDVDVLPLIINSVIGLNQLNRIGTGGVQTNISGFDILKIKIPILNQKIQKEISNKIIEFEHNRSLSKSFLEIAKRGVEMAIEKNEKEAEKWINSEIEKLKIKL